MKRFVNVTVLRGMSLAVIGISVILSVDVVAQTTARNPGQNHLQMVGGLGAAAQTVAPCPDCSQHRGKFAHNPMRFDGLRCGPIPAGYVPVAFQHSRGSCKNCLGTLRHGVIIGIRQCVRCRGTGWVEVKPAVEVSPGNTRDTPSQAINTDSIPVAAAGIEHCKGCEKGYITTKEECGLCENGINHLRIKDGEFECRLSHCKGKHPTRFTPCICGSHDCPRCEGRGFNLKKEKCPDCIDGIITPLKALNAPSNAKLKIENKCPFCENGLTYNDVLYSSKYGPYTQKISSKCKVCDGSGIYPERR